MPGASIQRELALLVTGKDVSATRTLKGVDRQVSNLERHVGKASRNIAGNIEHGVVAGSVAAAGAIAYAVNTAMDFESAIAGIAKTVDGDITTVVDGLRDLARETPTSFEELAGIAELGGAMGIAKEDLVAFTEQVAILANTTDISADQAATALGQMGNIIGLTAAEFDNFAAALVDLGNKGNSTESAILEIARRSGGAAKLMHIARDETLGWAAAAANLGLNEELAGTALQNFFVKTRVAIANNGPALERIADTAGMTAKQFKKAFAEDASGALTTFLGGLSKLEEGERIKTIQKLFGKGSGLTRLLVGLTGDMDNLTGSIDGSTKAWEEATAAQAEADKRYATTASQMAIFKNNIRDAAAVIGAELLPMVNELAKQGVDWLQGHQPEIKQFARDLADGIRDAVEWAQSLDWDKIASSLQAGAGFAKLLVDAFLSAPSWVQEFLLAGFVANKFTGGVIGDVVGEMAKGLIKGVLGINAAVVNVNAATVRGGGGLPAGGGPAGAAGKGLGLASKVFLVGEAIGLVAAVAATWDAVNQESTAHAVEVRQTMRDWIAQSPDRAALENGLAGVEQGIADIKSNPLSVLVQGDALNQLEGMRTEIKAALAALDDGGATPAAAPPDARPGTPSQPGQSPEARDEARANADRITTSVETMKGNLQSQISTSGAETRDAAYDVRDGVAEARRSADGQASQTRATVMAGALSTVSAQYASSAAIVGAISRIPAPVTYVNVSVTGNSVGRTQTSTDRNGGGNSSRDRDRDHPH